MRIIAPLVLLTACFGTPRSGPEAAPDAGPPSREPAEDPTEEDADIAAEESAPADEDVPLADVPDSVSARLPADVVLSLRRAKGRFDTASSAAEVAAAWRAADALAPQLEGALQPAYEATGGALNLGWLAPHLPGMAETYMAEGTALVFVLRAEPWKALAESTPEPGDDAFMALMERTWGSARPMGWPAWSARTWDYGGCSELGHGVVLEVLVLADAARAAGTEFTNEIAQTRELALGHLLEDDELFPRCNVRTMEPTSTDALHDEVDRILEQVKLTEAERAKVKARRAELTGQAHTGG